MHKPISHKQGVSNKTSRNNAGTLNEVSNKKHTKIRIRLLEKRGNITVRTGVHYRYEELLGKIVLAAS